jgi:integration host factor subunit beta
MIDSTVKKADLVEEVARVTDLPLKESEAIVETIFGSIISALQGGDRIEIRGFGSFSIHHRRGRIGRNPNTGTKVEVPPKRIPVFKPSRELKNHVNGGVPATPATGAAPAPRKVEGATGGLSQPPDVSNEPIRSGRCASILAGRRTSQGTVIRQPH